MKIPVRPFLRILAFAVAVRSASGAEPTCQSVPDGLVGWWQAESAPADAAGGADAVLLAGAGYGPGHVGQAFTFGGAAAGVELPLATGTLGGAFSWEAWVGRSDAGSVAFDGSQLGWIWSADAGWGLAVESDGRLRVRVPGRSDVVGSEPLLADTEFHHVALVAGSGTARVLVDGVERIAVPCPVPSRAGTSMRLGGLPARPSETFAGRVDEFSLFDRALGVPTIEALHAAGSLGKCLPPSDLANDVGPGEELLVQGSSAAGHRVLESDGFTVEGTLRLQSANSSFRSSLRLTAGQLTNAPTGQVLVRPGSGGSREITGGILNRGTVDITHPLTLDAPRVTYRNLGAWTVGTGIGLTLSGGGSIFHQADGHLSILGSFTGRSITFDWQGGVITNTPYLHASTLRIGPAATAPASFVVTHPSTRFEGDLHPGQTLVIQGNSDGGHTTVTTPAGFANRGTLRLQSANSSFRSSLSVPGTLTNHAEGRLLIQPGTGGARELQARLLNEGLLDIDQPLTLEQASAVHLNRGDVIIQPGKTLAVTGGGQTFRQESGAFSILGSFTGRSITFDWQGGVITNTPYLHASTLRIGPAATAPASFVVTHPSTRFEGDLHPGQTLVIQGNSDGGHTTVTTPAGFANRGILRLQSANSSFRSSISVPGTLTNHAEGRLLIQPGTGGARELQARLLNEGLLDIDQPLTLEQANAVHLNRGDVVIQPGKSLSLSGNGQTFRQESGVFSILGSFSGRSITFDWQGGVITNTPYLHASTLRIGPAATAPASFVVTHPSTRFEGDLHAGQTLVIQGNGDGGHTTVTTPAGFANRGTLRLQSANSSYRSSISVPGTLTNHAGGRLLVQTGSGGTRELFGQLHNEGLVDVDQSLVLDRAAGLQVNNGVIDVAPAATLFLNPSGSTFRQAGGELRIDGGLNAAGSRFENLGGLVSGWVYLPNGTLFGGPGAGPGGNFLLGGNGARMEGSVASGAFVWIRGDGAVGHTTVQAPAGLVNHGRLRLESANSGYATHLHLGAPLTNGPTGVIEIRPGSGGTRELVAPLWNEGQVLVAHSALLGRAGQFLVNEGLLTVDPGVQLTLAAPLQNTSGTLAGGGTLAGSVDSRGTIAPGASTGILTVAGDLAQSGRGTVEIELGGTTAGSGHDRLQVTGTARIGGRLRARLVDGHQPGPGDAYTVVTAGQLAAPAPVLELPPLAGGLGWRATFAGGIRLEAVPATDPQPDREVAGRVVGPDGQPVAGVEITASRSTLTGLRAEYWSNRESDGDPTLVRLDPSIDFTWNNGGPGGGVPVDNFSARWSGTLTPTATGTHTFHATTDDGLRLWVDGRLVIDDWNPRGSAERTGTVDLVAGEAVTVRMEFFDAGGPAVARLEWSADDLPRSVIPATALRPADGTPVLVPTELVQFATVTDADGRYVLPLEAGAWRVSVAGMAERGFDPAVALDADITPGSATVDFVLAPLSVPRFPDLVVEAVEVPATGLAGQPLEVRWTSRNAGDAPAGAPWTEMVLLATHPSGFNGIELGRLTVDTPLPAGAAVERRLTVTVPRDLTGTRFVVVRTDPGLQVDEGRGEGNNSTPAPEPIELLINDLVVDRVTAPATAAFGDAVDVEWVVRNAGGSPATGPWRDALRFVSESGGNGVSLGTVPAPVDIPLAPGEAYTNRLRVTLPLAGRNAPGPHRFEVTADAAAQVVEAREDNNDGVSGTVDVSAPPPPDLVVVDVTLPDPAPAGQPLTVTWTVRNDGSTRAVGPWVEALALAARADGADAREFARLTFPAGLEPGAAVTRSHRVILPAVEAGPRHLMVALDADDQVDEGGDPANNIALSVVPSTVTAADLSVTAFTVTAERLGEPATLRWTVVNAGNGPAAATWTDRVQLEGPTGPLVLVNSVRPGGEPLAPGARYDREVVVDLPLRGDLPAGAYVFAAIADIRADQFEGTRANNTNRTAAIPLSTPPLPDLVADAVTAPDFGLPGELVDVAWGVRNVGAAGVPAGWTAHLTVQPTNGPVRRLAVLSFDESLPPDASRSGTNRVRLPGDLAGPVRIGLVADAAAAVFESREDNNVAIAPDDTLVPLKLTLVLPVTSVPEDLDPPTIRARVFRSGPIDLPLDVTLSSGDTNEVIVPDGLAFTAGAAFAEFDATVRSDAVVDGPKAVTLAARAEDFTDGLAVLTVLDADRARLVLELGAPEVREGLTVPATIRREAAGAEPLEVRIGATGVDLLTPDPVVIPAGELSVMFTLVTVDNDVLEADRDLVVTATAPDHLPSDAALRVRDDEDPGLTVAFDRETVGEGAGPLATTAVIRRAGPVARPLRLRVQVSDPATVVVAPFVLLPAGVREVAVPVGVIDNPQRDGDRTVEAFVEVFDGFTGVSLARSAAAGLRVTDDDGPALTLRIPGGVAREGRDPALTAVVGRNTPPDSDLVVTLESSDTGEATVPASVVIPAGQVSVPFPIATVDDGEVDGNRPVGIRATAEGFAPAAASLTVTDGDLPDLVVAEVGAPASGLAGNRATVGFRLLNQGFSTAAGPFLQRVIASRDAVLDEADPVLAEVPFAGNLPAGETFGQELSVSLPDGVGGWHLFVVADTGRSVAEVLESNNVGVAPARLSVQPAYTASVSTAVTVAAAGTPVPLAGDAVRPDGTPAAFEPVTIHVEVRGAVRTLAAITDGDGRFSARFEPFPTEHGLYRVGATHPGTPDFTAQDEFELLFIRPEPVTQSTRILPGRTNTLSVRVTNVNGRNLTGIEARVSSAGGLAIAVNPPTQLSAGETREFQFTVAATDERDASGRFVVRLTSAEGAVGDFAVDYSVEPPYARLAASPTRLEAGMVRGGQTQVTFRVSNQGGADSGPLELTLPDAPWLRAAAAGPLPSLAPGESTLVTLLLTPDGDLPLEVYEGRLAVGNPDAAAAVSFAFRNVSEALGDLRVTAQDELSYYGTNHVNVAGALVSVRDVYTSALVTNGITGAGGTVTFTGLPEGAYNLEVSAPRHDSYRRTIRVMPGTVNDELAFLRTQLVRYNWQVEEIDIEERARVTLDTVFETSVPVPVVTIEPGVVDLSDITTPEHRVELKVTNHGLIAAQDVRLQFEDGSRWAVEVLTADLGAIPPASSISVPVVFRRIDLGDGPAPGGSGRRAAPAAGGGAGCRGPSVGIDWALICGPFGVAYWAPVVVIDRGACPVQTGPGGGRHRWIFDPLGGGVGYSDPGGPGRRGFPIDIGRRSPVTYSEPPDCRCDPSTFAPRCSSSPEVGLKAEIDGRLRTALNAALAASSFLKLGGIEIKANGKGKLCTCCTQVNGQDVTGLQLEAEGSFEAEVKIIVGGNPEATVDLGFQDGVALDAKITALLGGEVAVGGSLKGTLKTKCLLEDPTVQIDGKVSGKVFVGGKGSVSLEGRDIVTGQTYSGGGETATGLESGVSAGFSYTRGPAGSSFTWQACVEPVVLKSEFEVAYGSADTKRFVKWGGPIELAPQICRSSGGGGGASEPPPTPDLLLIAEALGQPDVAALYRSVTGRTAVPAALLDPDATARMLSDALSDGLAVPAADSSAPPRVVYESRLRPASEPTEPTSRTAARAAGSEDGTCAQIRLVIEQEAVVTRKAIGATLEIVNETDDTPLEDIGVTLLVYDEQGNDASDRFIVLDPELTRLEPMEDLPGDRLLLGGLALRLPPATTGSARWIILPRDEAAPETVTRYFVGGYLSYRAGDVVQTAELVPGPVNVHPNARLALKYFHQRDVFADDPFTDAVEPSVPFVLGVMVQNRGAGVARNLAITSGRPEIVDNAKGLLVDFDILAAEVAGRSLTPSLTVDFGDVGPGGIAIGRWLLRSSLQGLFIGYDATLEHEDRFGEKGASVFESVGIHELIHQVQAPAPMDDGRPDFLVNDVDDDRDLPDTVHLSDGTTAPVEVVEAGAFDGPPTADDREVELSAAPPSGWVYLRLPDPADGGFILQRVVRSDGRELPVGINAWTTDRTFIGLGRRPVAEHVVHLFDHDSTGRYTLVYRRDERLPDTVAPASGVAALPAVSPALVPVRWSGSDDGGGSGIAGFDIHVSTDGGPFERWLTGTRATSALYPGAAGRTYAFFSVARDEAGNVEPAPGVPDATTLATGNSPPVFGPVADISVDEGALVEVALSASDADLPANALVFSLGSGPAGVQVDPVTGRLRWQTDESSGPAVHPVTVRVTDDGEPPLSAETVVRIEVREVNRPPALSLPAGPLSVPEGSVVEFTAVATDPDQPANPLRFRLVDTAPAGATIHPVSGAFRWIPSEAQGGSDHTVTVEVDDGGQPALTARQPVVIRVAKVNSAPLLERPSDWFAYEGDLIVFTNRASDTDLPPQRLTFRLADGAPPTATLSAEDGIFRWTPMEGEVPGTNAIGIVVGDDATPSLVAETAFTVVTRALDPGLNLPRREANGEVRFRFKGEAGGRYVLEASIDLLDWDPVQEFLAEEQIFTLIDQSSTAFPWRYFRVRRE